ncbi:MAG TPA: hypothetical protein VM689_14250 [Aliidongia sp.]|nr:hypothetical protein [Aliidongia sp.]
MWRIIRTWRDRAVQVLTRVEDLTPHLRKDLNLWEEGEHLAPDSIRKRNRPLPTSF